MIPTSDGQDLRLAVDHEGSRHLLVGIRSTDRKLPEDVVSALTVRRKAYTFGGESAAYLDVRCIRGDLFGTFDELLLDVVTEVSNGGGADAALAVVERWRRLLAVRGRQTLSNSAQRGLFAELHALRIAQPSQSIDVREWRGPLREPHDILSTDFALEVKSTGAQGTSIEIHGPLQLAEPARPLALVLVELDEDPGGTSVADMADRLVDDAADRDLALSRLAMAGYVPSDTDAYPVRFTVNRIRFVPIGEETPRIVPAAFAGGTLPQGLAYLNYGIELAALERFLMEGESALLDWIESTRRDGDM